MNLINPDVIKNSTVWRRDIFNNGRYYEREYFGLDGDLVEKKSKDVVDSIASYRSPAMSSVQKRGDMYFCIISYYGLD